MKPIHDAQIENTQQNFHAFCLIKHIFITMKPREKANTPAFDTVNDKNNNNNSNNNSSNNSEKIDFNDDLKKQIAVAGEAYVEFYFEYGEGTAPSAFAEQAYEDTENDTPLGEYKEQGKTIFMNAFKEAYEATGNEYY